MADLKVAQLRPPHAEDIAQHIERWAREAREGAVTGYSIIAIRPDGTYAADGWQAKEANAFQEMGLHMTCILNIWEDMHKERF